MAKIKFGMMMTDARGKLGGQVFSKNRGGSYIRTKVTPSNPQTVSQQLVRSALGTISQLWNSLSNAQIASFNSAVNEWKKTDVFGDIKVPSGKNLFTKLNVNLLNSGQNPILAAPDKMALQLLPNIVISYDAAADTWDLSNMQTVPNALYQVEFTPPVPNGVNYVKNRFRVVAYGADAAVLNASLVTAYPAKFGSLATGDKVFARVRLIGSNGQASAPVQVLVDIT